MSFTTVYTTRERYREMPPHVKYNILYNFVFVSQEQLDEMKNKPPTKLVIDKAVDPEVIARRVRAAIEMVFRE